MHGIGRNKHAREVAQGETEASPIGTMPGLANAASSGVSGDPIGTCPSRWLFADPRHTSQHTPVGLCAGFFLSPSHEQVL